MYTTAMRKPKVTSKKSTPKKPAPKKGSQAMKDKMAKLRAMKGKK